MLSDFFRVTPKRRRVKLIKRRGILFNNPGILGKTIFYTGTWLLMIAVVYAIYLYWPIAAAYSRFWISSRNIDKNKPVLILPTPTPLPIGQEKDEYTITIPKILAFSKIVASVSPLDPKEYLKVLEENVVAQAKNTSYPGMGPGHTTYIFAHSTNQGLNMLRINAVFYLLGELKKDDIIFINRNGINYTYKVYKQLVVNASQIEYLNYTEPAREVLIMQTCWPIGTDWKRLLIFAELIRN